MCAACCCTSVVPVGFSSMILQSWFRCPSVFSTFSIAGRMTSLKRRSTLRENSVPFVFIASRRLAASDLFWSNSSMTLSSAVFILSFIAKSSVEGVLLSRVPVERSALVERASPALARSSPQVVDARHAAALQNRDGLGRRLGGLGGGGP